MSATLHYLYYPGANGWRIARLGGQFRKVEAGRFFAGVTDELIRRPADFLFNVQGLAELEPVVIAGLERLGKALRGLGRQVGYVVSPAQDRLLRRGGQGLDVIPAALFADEARALQALGEARMRNGKRLDNRPAGG